MASGRDALAHKSEDPVIQVFPRQMDGPWGEAFSPEMNDGKIIPDFDPTLDAPSSTAMDSLQDRGFGPLTTGNPLRAHPSSPVSEVKGELGPASSILKGLQVELGFVVPDGSPMEVGQHIPLFLRTRESQFISRF